MGVQSDRKVWNLQAEFTSDICQVPLRQRVALPCRYADTPSFRCRLALLHGFVATARRGSFLVIRK
jgi:hypothetical protein